MIKSKYFARKWLGISRRGSVFDLRHDECLPFNKVMHSVPCRKPPTNPSTNAMWRRECAERAAFSKEATPYLNEKRGCLK
ncbi:hypothetical protein CEXT_406961 [Caerostris extrusa]|uniref:Uncharacterized protein n=1 Tax=Caerostris extrusa TaxID=172846 RepID=A0AAV4XXT2_CAEEX|nr:hypothetical protein CEXT_406961 [Caerostris extrusa]